MIIQLFPEVFIAPKEGNLLISTPDLGKVKAFSPEQIQKFRFDERFINLSFVVCRIARTPQALFAPINGQITQLVTFA